MCNIIEYGFTKNGGATLSSPTCTAITSDIIGAKVSISIEAEDVGIPMIANIGLFWNGAPTGAYSYESASYTPSSTGLWTFTIPFTGLTPKVGTYTFHDGCVYINAPDYSSQYCNKCDTTKCTTLTICTPNWQCETPLNGYEADGCGHRRTNVNCNVACVPVWACETPLNGYESDGCGNRRSNTNCNPLVQKWKCSNAATNTCIQASDGTFDTEALCKASAICQPAGTPKWKCSNKETNTCIRDDVNGTFLSETICKASSTCKPSGTPADNTLIYVGLAAAGVAVLYLATKKK